MVDKGAQDLKRSYYCYNLSAVPVSERSYSEATDETSELLKRVPVHFHKVVVVFATACWGTVSIRTDPVERGCSLHGARGGHSVGLVEDSLAEMLVHSSGEGVTGGWSSPAAAAGQEVCPCAAAPC
jgi:hypothetical protein